tara:strand:+ start:413 stop:862 length:450 start_codon:yes stop_codon:yes gene_type:complete
MSTIALLVSPLVIFVGLSIWSNFYTPYVGLQDGKLRQCPSKPNCVCSESEEGEEHFIHPLMVSSNSISVQKMAIAVILQMGGKIELETATFVHATFQTPIFRFKDDFELRFSGEEVQVRSASRVGYSDLGTNRKRVLEFQNKLEDRLSP